MCTNNWSNFAVYFIGYQNEVTSPLFGVSFYIRMVGE